MIEEQINKILITPRSNIGRGRIGSIFKTSRGITGIVVGYKAQKDYWIYWVETKRVTHYDTIEISKVLRDSVSLAHSNPGTQYIDVPAEYQRKFLELAKIKSQAIVTEMTQLDLGSDGIREVKRMCKAATQTTVATPDIVNEQREKVLFDGQVFTISIPSLGSIKVLGKNVENAWEVLRDKATIEPAFEK